MSTDNDEEHDFLNMSDDDFDKFGEYPPEPSEEGVSEVVEENEADSTENEEDKALPDEDAENEGSQESEEGNEEEESDSQEDGDNTDSTEEEESDDDNEEEEEENESELSEAEEFYQGITAPLKANGTELVIKSVDEARRLMQKGAGFERKLKQLKPARQLFKTLEKNNMTDADSIGFASDLLSGDKSAIMKLMQDKGINPLDLDLDADNSYKPTMELVPEQSIEFDDTLDAIKDSPKYSETINYVKGLDTDSQSSIAQDPQIVSHLNAHMENGTFDLVSKEVARLKALGEPNISRLSDLEAYVAVGHSMDKEGKLPNPSAGTGTPTNQDKTVRAKRKKVSNPETQAKAKKAAGNRRSKPASQKATNVNPLSLSDDDFDAEFEKMMGGFTS